MNVDHPVIERLEAYLSQSPKIGKDVYISKSAVVFGAVTIGDRASIWYNAVLRGDINEITVGEGTNVQDNAVLHIADDFGCHVGKYVTIGHSAVVHACRVGDETLVGMGSTILDGATVGNQCIIGANALVKQGHQIPDGSLVLGSPAKIVRSLSEEERSSLKDWADKYVANAAFCMEHKINVGAVMPI